MSFYQRGYTVISNGRSNGRSCHQGLWNGRVTVSGTDTDGKKFKRVLEIREGEIEDNALWTDGKVTYRIAYGRFESKLTPPGRETTRFYKGSGKGRHGKAVHFTRLFGEDVAVHSWYKIGRLVRQRVVYANGRLCYDWRGSKCAPLVVYSGHALMAGEEMFRITGRLNTSVVTGCSFLDGEMNRWFTHHDNIPFKVERFGKLWYAGEHRHGQKVGRWIEKGVTYFYEHGVGIPEKMFNTPPDKLDLKKLLKIPNAQVRMAMLEKARGDRSFGKKLAVLGREVHRDGQMRLYDVKGSPTRVLLVVCPSTQSRYFINVPADSKTCEQARQWTFHLGESVRLEGGRNEIKFTQET